MASAFMILSSHLAQMVKKITNIWWIISLNTLLLIDHFYSLFLGGEVVDIFKLQQKIDEEIDWMIELGTKKNWWLTRDMN